MSTNRDAHATTAAYRDLLLRFLAGLMTATIDASTPEAFQQATQAFRTALDPWFESADLPSQPHPAFCLFAECTFDEQGEVITVRLSPEGEAYFRAWVGRQGMRARMGLSSPQARAH